MRFELNVTNLSPLETELIEDYAKHLYSFTYERAVDYIHNYISTGEKFEKVKIRTDLDADKFVCSIERKYQDLVLYKIQYPEDFL